MKTCKKRGFTLFIIALLSKYIISFHIPLHNNFVFETWILCFKNMIINFKIM